MRWSPPPSVLSPLVKSSPFWARSRSSWTLTAEPIISIPSFLEAAITPKTRAILPVSLYGQCAEFDAINAVAGKYGIPVIEDAAQSFGATYRGRKSCALSFIGCTSFFPSKPLGCYGDAGACFTDDEVLATTMRRIRVHGQDRRYHHSVLGINGRMDTLQAAVLLAKLEVFAE